MKKLLCVIILIKTVFLTSIFSQTYSFSEIKILPYLGGSLLYNSDNQSASHLNVNNTYPIRLSSLNKVYNSSARKYEYFDIASKQKYGVISIQSISTSTITFFVTLYDYQGNQIYIPNPLKSLAINASTDIDGDGKNDLSYVKSINAARPSVTNTCYLTFICSQSTLTTCMFSYLPDKYGDLYRAGGNLGFNYTGNALINLGDLNATTSRSADTVTLTATYNYSVNPNIKVKDYILDNYSGRYFKVYRLRNNSNGTYTITANSSADSASIADVLPVYYVNSIKAKARSNFEFYQALHPKHYDEYYLGNFRYYLNENYNNKVELPSAWLPLKVSNTFQVDNMEFGTFNMDIYPEIYYDVEGENHWNRVKLNVKVAIFIDTKTDLKITPKIKGKKVFDYSKQDNPFKSGFRFQWGFIKGEIKSGVGLRNILTLVSEISTSTLDAITIYAGGYAEGEAGCELKLKGSNSWARGGGEFAAVVNQFEGMNTPTSSAWKLNISHEFGPYVYEEVVLWEFLKAQLSGGQYELSGYECRYQYPSSTLNHAFDAKKVTKIDAEVGTKKFKILGINVGKTWTIPIWSYTIPYFSNTWEQHL